MSSDNEPTAALQTMTKHLETCLAAAMVLAAALLCAFMPHFVASGGITSAQDFVTLSPVFFPRLAFAVLTALCAVYLFDVRRRARASRPEALEATRFRRGGVMILIIAAYSVLVSTLGYGLTTLVMAGVVIRYLGVRQLRLLVPCAVAMPIVVRFVFERLLLISLPRSDFESIARVEDAIMKFLSGLFLG